VVSHISRKNERDVGHPAMGAGMERKCAFVSYIVLPANSPPGPAPDHGSKSRIYSMWLSCQPYAGSLVLSMAPKPLSPQELRVWHAFKIMSDEVMSRVAKDLTEGAGLSGADFGVLSRLAGIGKGEMRQQDLARTMGWDKSRLSHQLTRMQERKLIERHDAGDRIVLIKLTKAGENLLAAARPVHAESVRRNLLSRLSPEQIATMVRISNILGED
jgi:DNA-binding MarR family transcriptional regulator